MKIKVAYPGRESLELELQLSGEQVVSAHLQGIGNLGFLRTIQQWRGKLIGNLLEIEMPKGNSAAEIMLREVILTAQGKWQSPYAEEEICHCRAVPTKVVEASIVGGAHTPEKVSRQTSASTSCGTCRSDVAALLRYRCNQ